MGGVDYRYDAEGRRVQQTVSSTVTKYLLDIQPGLSVVLSETTGSNVVRNVHAPKGIHARKDASNNWHWLMQDGLGSVRAEISNTIAVEGSQNFAPYGTPTDSLGSFGTYGFTGEPTDANGLVYDRARYYVPGIGMFASLDPFEGYEDEPMSINGYGYVRGNPVNWTDPSGKSDSDIVTAINNCASNPVCVAGVAAAVETILVFGAVAIVAFASAAVAAYVLSKLLNDHTCELCKESIPASPPPMPPLPPSGSTPFPVGTPVPFPGTPFPVGTPVPFPGTPFPVVTIPPIATPPPVPNVFMNQIRFSDRVESWVQDHLNDGNTMSGKQQLIGDLRAGVEEDFIKYHPEIPELMASQLTLDHIRALLWNQAGHIDVTIRFASAEDRWAGLKQQLTLGRYRFLADRRPALQEALDVELEALNHPSIPKDKRTELLQLLQNTLLKYR